MSATTAAAVALILYAIGGVAGIAWRGWRQRRRTGSTGIRAIGGRPGSPEWFGGVGWATAILVTLTAPALQLAGVLAPVLNAPWVHTLGIIIAVAGIMATMSAQIAMGDSWRIGVDPGETTTLVRTGLFGVVRNPIYSAMLVFWLGTTLLAPNVLALFGYALFVATIELQVRCIEEPYLLRVHGDAYRQYSRTVGRFFPGIGRIG